MVFRLGWIGRLAFTLLVTVLLLLVLLFWAPNLLKPTLNRLLPSWLGSEQHPATFHISQLSWRTLTIDQTSLFLDDGSFLQLKNIRLNYAPLELLQGKLKTVEIESIDFKLAEGAVKEAAIEAGQDAKEVAGTYFNELVEIPMLNQWLRLPLDSVQIQQINILHPQASAQLSANVTDGFWRLNGQVQVAELAESWTLELQLQDSGRWFLLLSVADKTLLQQYGTFQQTADKTQIQMSQKVYLAWLKDQVENLPPLVELSMDAQLEMPNQGILPAEIVGNIALELTTESGDWLARNDWQANHWSLTANKPTQEENWQLQLASQPMQVAVPAQWLEGLSSEPIKLTAAQQMHGHCLASLEQCSLSLRLQQQLFNTHKKELLTLQLSPNLDWHIHQGVQMQLPVQLTANSLLGKMLDQPIKKLQVNGDFAISYTPAGLWQVSNEQGLSTELAIAEVAGWQPDLIQASVLPKLRLHGDLNAKDARQQLQMDPLQLQVSALTIRQPTEKAQLNIEQSNLSCRPFVSSNGLTAICQLGLALGQSHYGDWPIPDSKLSGSLTLRQQPQGSQLSSQLQLLTANEQMKMRIHLSHDLERQTGGLQWHLADTLLNWQSLGLKDMLKLTEFDLLDGTLAGQGWLDWQQQEQQGWEIKPDISLRIDNLTATYSDVFTMEKWNGLFSLRRPLLKEYLLDAQFSGQSLNPGIELKNILARSQTQIASDFSYAVANIYEVRTDLLGGTVRTPLVHYDTRRENNAFTVELDHIQLSQITALEPSSEVKATGILDGIIPVVITPQGPQVPAGNLFARDPGGVVRYQNSTADALAGSNQNMGMAMQLLQNFQYDHLQTMVQYQPDGKFNLGLQFQGRNPDFFSGKPTHLNVSLDYNLLDLLESLRLTEDLINRVEQKYQ